jgi:6-phosphogluconolactonase
MTPARSVHVFDDSDALSRAAADEIEREAIDATAARLQFMFVLSGGSTPGRLFEHLAAHRRDRIPWRDTEIFWADERFVPPDHLDSNFAMAEAKLLTHVPIPPSHIHRIPTESTSPTTSALEYETTLHGCFPDADSPAFDVVLLGLGEDGHTASLFPGQGSDGDKWVESVTGPPYRPPRERITLTLRALNGAETVIFLVTGKEKHRALRAMLDDPDGHPDVPATHIRPRGKTLWLVDREAYDGS